MALIDDVTKSFVPSALVGLGAVLLAPIVVPALSSGLRPLAKTLVKGGLVVADKVYEVVAEAGEQFNDMVAEARSEMGAAATEAGAAATKKPRAK
jgi:hypothetical protein